MPNYDYKCQECSLTLTITRGIAEEEKKPPCPNCTKVMIRVFKAPPVSFNSPGFYSTEGKI
jgi:putative FmdB family regulatory protein